MQIAQMGEKCFVASEKNAYNDDRNANRCRLTWGDVPMVVNSRVHLGSPEFKLSKFSS